MDFNYLKAVFYLHALLLSFNYINCQQDVCQNGGVLVLRPTGSVEQVCICPKNFIGQFCEIRLDVLSPDEKKKFGCELRPCWIGSTCEDRDGGFICHCSANTFGEFCEKSSLSNNDPCISKPCYNYGTCIQQDQNSYTCSCNGSYGGLSCKQNIVGACASNPCLKDGICIPIGLNDYKCQCPDWTIGKNCETVFNPCTRVSCMNNANCLKRRTLAFECNCTSDFVGVRCDQPLTQTCKSIPCAYGSCQLNNKGQYGCQCITGGYEGTYCEIEKCNPKCKYGVCQRDSTGNYYCACASSYRGPSCSDLVCFSGTTQVETLDRGIISISDLKRGDMVKTYDQTQSKWIYSKFVTYLHKDETVVGKYLLIKTSSNKTISISSHHFIARLNKKQNYKIEFVFAKYLKEKDVLISENSLEDEIIGIENVYEKGAYAPLTESGTISVNSIYASCYSNTIIHEIAHIVMQPIILINKVIDYFNLFDLAMLTSTEYPSNYNNGIYWYPNFFYNLLPYIPFSSYAVVF